MVRDTSLEAYHRLKESGVLGTRECKILRMIIDNPSLTDREISNLLGYTDPNKVRPRRKEFLDLGLIKDTGKRTCTISNRNAHTWSVNNLDIKHIKKHDVKKKRHTCPLCNGKGHVIKPQTNLDGY